jgi:hypothetical protein
LISRVIALAPLVLAIATTAVAAERRVVFAVLEPHFAPVPGNAKLFLEPIAWAHPLAPPPHAYAEGDEPGPETKAFIDRYFRRDREYTTWYDGRRGGTVRLLERALAGCVSLGMTASGRDIAAPAFATNFALPERTLRNRAATAEESAALLTYGKRWYAARGYNAGELQVESAELIDVGPEEEQLFAATIAVVSQAACEPRAMFVLARQGDVAARRVVPQVIIAPVGMCETSGNPSLFGHLDFDGDGIDEIVVLDHQVEGYEYLVLRRSEDGEWRIAVRGGGSGC